MLLPSVARLLFEIGFDEENARNATHDVTVNFVEMPGSRRE